MTKQNTVVNNKLQFYYWRATLAVEKSTMYYACSFQKLQSAVDAATE